MVCFAARFSASIISQNSMSFLSGFLDISILQTDSEDDEIVKGTIIIFVHTLIVIFL